jgi:hypothetical protein
MPEPTHPPRKIFISYRRSDHPDFVERIRDWFSWRYGRENVFIDFDSIRPASDWDSAIRREIAQSDALIVIIGPKWLKLLQGAAKNPDKDDYVRLEIQLALQEGKVIAPVCIKGARQPKSTDLPEELRPVFKRHFSDLNSGLHFLDNIERFMDSVEHEIIAKEAIREDLLRVERVAGFDVRDAIQNFENAEAVSDWETTLNWLRTIEQNGYEPGIYPVADFIAEMEENIARQRAEVDYDVIRSLVKRVESGRANGEQVWRALQKLWESVPSFDPDDLASRFRPMNSDQVTATGSQSIGKVISLEGNLRPTGTLQVVKLPNDTFFDKLSEIDIAEADHLFDTAELELASPGPDSSAELTLDQARALGLLDNL